MGRRYLRFGGDREAGDSQRCGRGICSSGISAYFLGERGDRSTQDEALRLATFLGKSGVFERRIFAYRVRGSVTQGTRPGIG